jgi:hypothetical protein
VNRGTWELLIDYARQGYAASEQAEAYEKSGHGYMGKRAREREKDALKRVSEWESRARLGMLHGAKPVTFTGFQISSSVNVCEHGDHPAPAGHRFCSTLCAACDKADVPDGQECAGVCHRGGGS